MKAIVKTVDKGTTELFYEGVKVTIFPYRFLLSLTELILSILDLSLLVLENFSQHLCLLLQLTLKLLQHGKLIFLDHIPGLQLPQLFLRL